MTEQRTEAAPRQVSPGRTDHSGAIRRSRSAPGQYGMSDETLMRLVANARADFAAELHFAPSSSRPVLDRVQVEYVVEGRTRTEWIDDPEGSDVSQIGATLATRMQRVLYRSYGSDMGVQRALQRLEPWCHRRHVDKREPAHELNNHICAKLARFVVTGMNGSGEHGIEESWLPIHRDNFYRRLIRAVALQEDLDYVEACEWLSGALHAMERWTVEWQAGAA